jgi:hypothetical protein
LEVSDWETAMKCDTLGGLALVAMGVLGVARLLGQRGRRWGATAAEVRRALAGDELVPDAEVVPGFVEVEVAVPHLSLAVW